MQRLNFLALVWSGVCGAFCVVLVTACVAPYGSPEQALLTYVATALGFASVVFMGVCLVCVVSPDFKRRRTD